MQEKIKVSTVTTLKTSLKKTLSFVNYHLNKGVDHMYLFFDDPYDKAIAHLKGYENLSLIPCDRDHWERLEADPYTCVELKQKANATIALEYARKAEIEWLIHIDCDELLYGFENIAEYLNNIHPSIDILRFSVMEAAPQKMVYSNPFHEIRHFKYFGALSRKRKLFNSRKVDEIIREKTTRNWHRKRKIAKLLGSRSAWKKKFLYGHQNGKCALRTAAEIEAFECHFPIPIDTVTPNVAVSQTFYILHFDCMGFENWKQKWGKRINGQNNHDINLHPKQRLIFMKKIEEAFSRKESLKKLYKDLYYLSLYEMILLRTLGLVKKIRLPAKLFDAIE